MILARAIGTATATVKHPSLQGHKLLLVQPLQADGETPDGEPLLALDQLGADAGSLIVITSDGKYIRDIVDCNNSPARWSVIGIPD